MVARIGEFVGLSKAARVFSFQITIKWLFVRENRCSLTSMDLRLPYRLQYNLQGCQGP
jgi:hypothetical protein